MSSSTVTKMLSICKNSLLLLFLGRLLQDIHQFCPSVSASNYDSQLLDCTPTNSIKTDQPNLPCKIAQNPSTVVEKSSQDLEDNSSRQRITNILDINFNNLIRRQVQLETNDNNCTSQQKVSEGVICTPKNVSTAYGSAKRKSIDVHILPSEHDLTNSHASDLDPNVYKALIGSTSIIKCRFNISNPSDSVDLSFKLRWLRSVASSQGQLRNQSIVSDENYQVTISANRIWTLRRDGGLDLVLNDFEPSDAGDYFCQAISDTDSTILDERRVHVIVREINQAGSKNTPNFAEIDEASLYSAENLEKLLPSLRVFPEYSELAYGERTQLACVTNDLDPDPDPDKLEWHYEPFKRPGYDFSSQAGSDQQEGVSVFGLPANTSRVGNVLIIWFMSHETVGIYKCSNHLADFNLTAEASAELAMRPAADSAPLVYINPELMRLSVNGSAKIQCESTGYPAPSIEWYRVEPVQNVAPDNSTAQNPPVTNQSRVEQLDGLQVLGLESRDAMAYCLQSGCRALDNLDPLSRHQKFASYKTLVTGLSWIQINGARANHQGQYVCKATNKHGTNQASSIIDVEFKEMPVVEIDSEHKQQTIVLDSSNGSESSPVVDQAAQRMQNVSFRCTIRSGQPKPRLKWLRTSGVGDSIGDLYKSANLLDGHDHSSLSNFSHGNLDIYDLTRVSSATSRVATRYENNGRTLILQLSTISVDDEGDYICLGENELGRHSAVAQLVVRKPPQIRILQTSPRVFRPNESFQLDCLVSGHPSPIDIEWSRSDRGAYFSLISRHSPSLSAHQERAVLKFDRTAPDEAGEYTCAARDPLNEFNILRDTIMLLAEDQDQQGSRFNSDDSADGGSSRASARHVPKLLVRPTKITAEIGSNITLDCLAVSGLQPTVVEWIAPASALISQSTSSSNHVRPYYRSPLIELTHGAHSSPDALLQFGSKLRLFNASRAHEGVYQCKGRNKAGIENAPALVTIIDRVVSIEDSSRPDDGSGITPQGSAAETKTKIARMGSNIELRCQVNGVDEQPATSWSREGRQLPQSSVQIDHNLWIQNLTKADEGLYLCSVRSREPNEIIQAKIKLLVHEAAARDDSLKIGASKYNPADFNAKIVASKDSLNVGDSVTLECTINYVSANGSSNPRYSSRVLDDLERQVVWTNLHSGQSLFQDNVYIQNNLLIIYDLKLENTATYRCNYNDLTQHSDYKLQISFADQVDQDGSATSSSGSAAVSDRDQFGSIITGNYRGQHLNTTQRVKHIKTSIGARLVLECPEQSSGTTGRYFWTEGRGPLQGSNSSEAVGAGAAPSRRRIGREMEPLVLSPVETSHAGLYQCTRQLAAGTGTQYRIEMHFLVEVQVISAKFVQRPVSFVTLPAVSDADHQLELEMKFFPEHDHGLMLFSGAVLANTLLSGLMIESSSNNNYSNPQNNKSLSTLTSADYISLGLVRGHLEFRFELGDGVTLLRSLQPLKLNQWHRLLIERNRRGATMWLDGQAPQSISSKGKFFNLNLDSLLYVGGHQIFLTLASADYQTRHRNSTARGAFYGFARGYQGCISYLRINGRELNLMSRNRSVAMGIFECDKPECPQVARNLTELSGDQVKMMLNCSGQNGLCQVDRSLAISTQPEVASTNTTIKRMRTLPSADLRCVCAPGFSGSTCNESLPPYEIENVSSSASNPSPAQRQNPITLTTTLAPPSVKSQSSCDQYPDAKCNITGTGQCQSLSSTVFRCHCKIGSMGELCNEVAVYTSETSVGFNQPAHVQLSFNSPQEVSRLLADGPPPPQGTGGLLGTAAAAVGDTFNETEYVRLTTFTESQNITFNVQTRASYGLLFYVGQISNIPMNEDGSYKVDLSGNYHPQTSKSVVANLLARLLPTRKVGDFLAIALVDGHIELSYELGSGLAILRSSRRINDGAWHKIEMHRSGKSSRLTIDDLDKHEAHSPGNLSMLNVDSTIHLGGLPTRLQATISSSTSSGSLLSTFMGCLSSLQINSLGPINLIRSDHLTRLESARNLVPCNNGLLSSAASTTAGQARAPGDKISIDQGAIKPAATEAPPMTLRRSSRRPTKPSHKAENDDDEADELARRSS